MALPLVAAQLGFIGDKTVPVPLQRRFHHRMAAVFDMKGQRFIDKGPRPAAFFGAFGQRRGNIKLGQRIGHRFDGHIIPQHRIGELVENCQFQRQRAIGGRGNLAFQLVQLGGRKAHCALHGLAMHEQRLMRGLQQFLADRLRHFDKIAEKIIVLDAQGLGMGGFGILGLQTGNHLPAGIAQGAGLIQLFGKSGFDETAIARAQRQRFVERLLHQFRQAAIQLSQSLMSFEHVGGLVAVLVEQFPHHQGGQHAVTQRGQIARPAPSHRQTRQSARQIGGSAQNAAHIGAQSTVCVEKINGIEPVGNQHHIGQRAGQPLAEQARAARCDRAVERCQQTALFFARQSARQFQIGAGGGIKPHAARQRIRDRHRQRRPRAQLGALDIDDDRGRGDDLGAAERAETR